MVEFQKSLIRFLYVALGVAVVLAVWTIARPSRDSVVGVSAPGMGAQSARGVTATGTCVVRTKPELVEVDLGVKQSGKTARFTKAYVKTTGRKIIRALMDGGVAAKDIQTEHFSLQSQWREGDDWQVKNWSAQENLHVRIRDIGKAAELIDAAVKAGANRAGGLRYTVENLADIRSQGRAKAAEVARKKAAELSSSLGGKLGRLVGCSEQYPDDSRGGYHGYYGWNDYYDGYYGGYRNSANAQVTVASPPAAEPGPEELTLQPGEMVTTVVVTATYELE